MGINFTKIRKILQRLGKDWQDNIHIQKTNLMEELIIFTYKKWTRYIEMEERPIWKLYN